MPLNVGYLTSATDKASDEVFTPALAITPLIKHIDYFLECKYCSPEKVPRQYLTIWCPFDESDSYYVKILSEKGYTVIHSHINEDKNFFYWEPEQEYDVIISNPPFSIKDDVLKHLYELDKPYAMLLPIPALQGQRRFDYIKDCEAIIFDKRVNYYKDKELQTIQKGVSFGSFYLCRKFLNPVADNDTTFLFPQKNLIFEKLEI